MAETHTPKVKEASFLHRLFGVTPGHAPKWAGGGCDGGIVDTVGFVGLGLAGMLAADAWGCWVAWLVAPLMLAWIVVIGRFEDRERFGRARIHRGECVWCGRAQTAPGSQCPDCSRFT